MVKLVSKVDRFDRTFPICLDLRPGVTSFWTQLIGPATTFVMLALEGTLLEGDPAALSHVRVCVDIGPRIDIHTIGAHQITPHDSVLEARVRRLESLLDGILELADAADARRVQRDHQIDQMASVMRKLGWKPHGTVDHRRLIRPQLVASQQELTVRFVCGKTPLLEPPFRWMLTVHGIESRHSI